MRISKGHTREANNTNTEIKVSRYLRDLNVGDDGFEENSREGGSRGSSASQGGALVHGGEKNGGRKWFGCSGLFEGSRELDEAFGGDGRRVRGSLLTGFEGDGRRVQGRLVHYSRRRRTF